MIRTPVARNLPDFPWDSLAAATAVARAHPGGVVDLSVGTPVDPVAPVIRDALAAAAAAGGYPPTEGTTELREAAAAALTRRYRVTGADPSAILPVVGTKEAIAWLPTMLGLGADHTVVVPELAYPTYEVGARLAGARVLRADGTAQVGPMPFHLVFINSPANPHGKILGIDHLRKMVDWTRSRGAILVADECYLGLAWEGEALSILDPAVSGGDHTGLIAVHSLSKTSNLAGYRAGFLAGDPGLLSELLQVRRHAGMMMPGPVQAAMTAALTDDAHEAAQRERYRARRAVLYPALERAGFTVDESAGGLYLWATRGEDGRATVDGLAERGVLVAPGDFYGPRGAQHVRISLTATDERIAEAAERITA